MHALILWLLLSKVRITAMARTQGVLLVFMSALFICVLQRAGGAIFEIQNNCRFTVWAAGSSGGGKRLDSGQLWSLQVASDTTGTFWGRTGCSFNGNGRGSCNTGDCGGLLNCQGSGKPPATFVEYSVNKINYSDFYDISLVDGFNLPVSIIPSNSSCHAIACSSNISAICPAELRVSGGCNSACNRFNTSQYCCTGDCGPTNYSMVFKRQCPQAYSYALDDTATFTCPGGTDYKVVFCGGNATSLQGMESVRAEPSFGYCGSIVRGAVPKRASAKSDNCSTSMHPRLMDATTGNVTGCVDVNQQFRENCRAHTTSFYRCRCRQTPEFHFDTRI